MRGFGIAILGVALFAFAPSRALAGAAPLSERAGLDEITLSDVAPVQTSICVDKWLDEWARRLQVVIFVDPQINGMKLRFQECEVPLTWGLAKKVLDAYDLIFDEREVHGHWVLFAHLRHNISCGHIAPPAPAPPRTGSVVTSLLKIRHGAGAEIASSILCSNTTFVPEHQILILVDWESRVELFTRVVRFLDAAGPGLVVRAVRLHVASAADLARLLGQLFPQGELAPRFLGDEHAARIYMATSAEDADAVDAAVSELDRPRRTLRSIGLRLRARLGEQGVTVLGLTVSGLALLWSVLFFFRARDRRRARPRRDALRVLCGTDFAPLR